MKTNKQNYKAIKILLNEAKKLGDIFVVAINSDESVKKLKGETRPVNTINIRINNLRS